MVSNDFSPQGLSTQEAQRRLGEFGPNKLTETREFSKIKLFLSQFKSPLIYILLFAGLVTTLLQEWTDVIVIMAAVLINTILGFYQEYKAQQSMKALRSFLTSHAKVIRDGRQQEIEAADLVPDDLVILTIGTRIPADGVLVEATDFSVNEAILTGESMPVKKSKTKDQKFSASPCSLGRAKYENKVFMGTTVVTGIAKMVVAKTGMKTQMGKIGQQVSQVGEEQTPLQTQLGKLAKTLAIIVGALTVLIFITGELLGYEPVQMFTTSVAIAVAAIPEGLVVTLTVILALGMQRILKRKALVRKLLATETLGSVSMICADKTGTLTEGKMQVVDAKLQLTPKIDDQKLSWLVKAAILCNDMRDPLEVGMMEWAEKEIKNHLSATGRGQEKSKIKDIIEKYPRLDEIPFSPDYKYIATLHRVKKVSRQSVLFFSGAPEVVLAKSKIQSREFKSKWQEEFERLGSQGYRLVGFAYKKLKANPSSTSSRRGRESEKLKSENLKELEWLGVLVYEDPVRKGTAEALRECQKAGIKIKVITGDYPQTAVAVLKQLGYQVEYQTQVMTGSQLKKISKKELEKQIDQIILFARTDPEQKLKIVQALKEKGEIVAMTGDGVNDAPALAKADIGIVVGSASDVAKETADMVLLDSNFSTIVHAVEEGRTIFENIKKVVLYLLSDSFAEVILVGGALFLGLPLPVTAAQILWVNLVEDAVPGMALAFEPEEKEVMREPPRPRKSPILDLELKTLIFIIGVLTDVFLLVLFYWLQKGVFHLHYVQTVMFVALGIDSLFIAMACRTLKKPLVKYPLFSNRFMNLSLMLSFFLLMSAVYFPPFQQLLRTHALGWHEWLFLLGIGMVNLLAIEAGKWVFIIRRKKISKAKFG